MKATEPISDNEIMVFLLRNFIKDERSELSPPEHRQVLLLLRLRRVSAATVFVLQLAVSLESKSDETGSEEMGTFHTSAGKEAAPGRLLFHS